MNLLPLDTWVPILDGDSVAAAIYAKHYSSLKSRARRAERGTMLFVGPGEKLILSTPDRTGLFAWRRERFRRDGQTGIECAIFSNLGQHRASELIGAADAIADARWPGERHFTFVNPAFVSVNPGYCFKMAGWRFCGRSKERGLHILERVPPVDAPAQWRGWFGPAGVGGKTDRLRSLEGVA